VRGRIDDAVRIKWLGRFIRSELPDLRDRFDDNRCRRANLELYVQ